MKVCVVGCGHWGSNHIREFYNLTVLSCICDSDENLLQKYKEKYDVPITTNFDEALGFCDSVVIALPSKLHFEFAKKSLIADKDVFVEKPITLNPDEAQILIDIAKERNKILMVGHIMLYNPCYQKLKEYLHKIGNIKYIRASRFNFLKQKSCDNVLWDLAPHDLSEIFDILNVNNYNDIVINHCRMTSNDICHISARYNDVDFDIELSRLSPYKESKLVIVGDRGIISSDDVDKKINVIEFDPNNKHNSESNITQYEISISDETQSLTSECKHFVECCGKESGNRIQPKTSGEDGLKVVGFIQRCDVGNSENLSHPNKYYVHPTSFVEHGAKIGRGTKIWHFCHLGPNADIGENCSVGQNCVIDTKLGSGCRLQNNIGLCKEIKVGDRVFFGPDCVFTNDKTPRLNGPKKCEFTGTIIEDDVSIGSNATIVCGIKLGKGCLIGAGSVVTKNVEPYTVVVGNPARKIKTIDEHGNLKD